MKSTVFLIGLIFHLISYEYQFGSISNPGPGFFPRIVSALLIILGILILAKGHNGISK